MFVDGLITGDVGDATLGKAHPSSVSSRSPSSYSVALAVRSHRRTCTLGVQRGSQGAFEPVALKVQEELETLAAGNVTDPGRIAQAVRRTVGKWVGETYRRQPMIVPTVLV